MSALNTLRTLVPLVVGLALGGMGVAMSGELARKDDLTRDPQAALAKYDLT